MSLYIMLTAALALSGLVMAALTLVYRSRAGEQRRLVARRKKPVSEARFWRYAAINSTLSVGVVYGLTYLAYPVVFHEGPASAGRVIAEGLAVLAVYDVLYYLMHRYPFHRWKLLRRVHAVHHAVKAPSAIDSLYLHPLENFLGLALLWASAALVALAAGPLSGYGFAWAFALYSVLNIAIHSGLRLPAVPFGLFNYLAARHQGHHEGMKAQNFASVSPLPDLLFGTEVRRAGR